MSRKSVIHIVDDDPAVRESLAALLEVKGYEVAVHESAEALLTSLAPEAAGCVLADVRMPGRINGCELARCFREVLPEIAVIYASGYSDDSASPVAGGLFFNKPYRMEQVIAAMRRLTGQHETSPSQG